MSIRSEQLKFDIVVNDNKSQKKLIDLEQANRAITDSVKELKTAKQKLNDADRKSLAELTKLNKELDKQKQINKETTLNIRELTLKKQELINSGNAEESQIKEINNEIKKQNTLLAENKNVTAKLKQEKNEINNARKQNKIEVNQLNNSLKEQNSTLIENKSKMKALREEIGLTALTPKQLKQELRKLKLQLDNTFDPSEIKRLDAEVEQVDAQLRKLTGTAKKTNNALDQQKQAAGGLRNQFSMVGAQVTAVIASLTAFVAGAMKIVEVRAMFQKFEAVLTNTLGSNSKAQAALSRISEFAANTPFAVDELTDSFVKLANQGFQPTIDEMTKLGDIAASKGKDFNQLAEAVIDAEVGEFERLKEFGIRSQKSGDNVTFTFKGVEKQVKFTDEAIREYILSLGDLQGVSGSMAAISQTLGGQISNLEDNFTNLLNEIGKGSEGAFSNFILLLNQLIGSVKDYIAGDGKGFLDFFTELSKSIFVLKDIYADLTKSIGVALDSFLEMTKVLGIFSDSGSIAETIISVLTFTLKLALFPINLMIGGFTLLAKTIIWVIENVSFVSTSIEYFTRGVNGLRSGVNQLSTWFGNLIDDLVELAEKQFPAITSGIKHFLYFIGILNNEKQGANDKGFFSDFLGIDNIAENQALFEKKLGETQLFLDRASKKKVKLTKDEKKTIEEIEDEYHKLKLEKIDGTIEKEIQLENESFEKRKTLFAGNYEALRLLKEVHTKNLLDINQKYEDEELQQTLDNFYKKQENEAQLFELKLLQKQLDAERLAQSTEELDAITETLEAEKLAFEKQQAEETTAFLIGLDQDATASKITATNIAIQQQQKQTDKTAEELEKRKKLQDEQNELFRSFAVETSSLLAESLISGEASFKSFGKQIILSALDILKKIVLIQIAQATGYSLSSADSVATLGATGFAKAAILTGLIEGAFAGVKAKVSQFSDGRYDVIGATDGKSYNVPFIGQQKTGFLPSKPALISENGREAIISANDLKNPQIGSLFNQIRYISMNKVPQYETGRLPQSNNSSASVNNDELLKAINDTQQLLIEYVTKVDSWATGLTVSLDTEELGDNQTEKKKLKSGTEIIANSFEGGEVSGSKVMLDIQTLYDKLDNRYLD